MTYLKTFAGVIALLCAMILSNSISAQNTKYLFSACAENETFKSVKFNISNSEIKIEFYDTTVRNIAHGDSIELRWFSYICTSQHKGQIFHGDGIYMSWKPDSAGKKYGFLTANIALKKIEFENGRYTFTCALSQEQAKYLGGIGATPGICTKFEFCTLGNPF